MNLESKNLPRHCAELIASNSYHWTRFTAVDYKGGEVPNKEKDIDLSKLCFCALGMAAVVSARGVIYSESRIFPRGFFSAHFGGGEAWKNAPLLDDIVGANDRAKTWQGAVRNLWKLQERVDSGDWPNIRVERSV